MVNQSKERPLVLMQISANERVNMKPSSLAVVDAKNCQIVNLSASWTLSKTVRNELSALLLPESSISTSPMMSSV